MEDTQDEYQTLCKFVTPIAHPLADVKLNKKVVKLARKAYKLKSVKIGVKAVQKAIRKKEKGIVILAGDTSPIDIISHLPILCEENDLPYIYTPSKNELGAAFGSNRTTCAILITNHNSFSELFDKISIQISKLPIP